MNCIICGKEIEKSKFSNAVLCSSECFHINFWNGMVADKDSPLSVRAHGVQYHIGREDSKSSFRGFYGRHFVIQFFDSRIVETTNLWMNGDIPERYKSKLLDNAIFIL